MSKFRKSTTAFQSLQSDIGDLSRKLNQAGLGDDVLEQASQAASDLQVRFEELVAAVDDLVRLASESDPDRKVFGDSMIAKVKHLAAQLDEFKDVAQSTINSAKEKYQPVLERKRHEEESNHRKLLEEKERAENEKQLAAKAEEERLRKHEEEVRKAAEIKAKQEAEEERMERMKYEVARGVRMAVKSATAQDEQRLAKRRERAMTMALAEVLDIIESNNPPPVYKKAVKALQDIIDNIVANPENSRFRTIKKANAKIQSDLLSLDGGIEAMLCLGFAEKEADSATKETLLTMVEPMVEDFDQWSAWFEKLQQNQTLLQTTYNGLC